MNASLRNHFLIAMPGLRESLFAHSITYLCEHDQYGAMGIVVNRALDISFDDIFEHLEIHDFHHSHPQPVLAGGPVSTERGFVLHWRDDSRRWQATLDVSAEISLTTSRDILESIAHDDGPENALIALGYAGWGPGQLEQELGANAWLTLPAEATILFNVPLEQRVQAAASRLGINLDLLSATFGNA